MSLMKYREVAVLPITIGNSFLPAALTIQADMIRCFAFFLCTLSWHLLVFFSGRTLRSKIRPHSRYLLGHIFKLGLKSLHPVLPVGSLLNRFFAHVPTHHKMFFVVSLLTLL